MSAVSGSTSSSSTSSSTSSTDPDLTTASGTGGQTTFNISGLASGIDDSEIISELMSIAQQPEIAIENQITLETTRQSDLQAIQTQLQALSTAVSELVDPATWSTSQQISTSDPTTVTATGSGVPPGGWEISVSQLARASQLTQGSSMTSAADNDQLTIQVGSNASFQVNVNAGDSLQTIANSINSAAGSGTPQIYASVVNSKLVLTGEQTGAANTIAVTSTGGGTVAADLGLTQTVTPQDAKYTVDGGSTQTSASNAVTNIATGMTVTLQGVTSSPVSVTVAQSGVNADGVQTALQDFVTAYNQTVTAIEAKLNETIVANPTTDADRAQGDLSTDPSLQSVLQSVREAVSDVFSGAPQAMSILAQAGLSTGAAVGTASLNPDSINGLLTLDTNQLSSALTSNFQNVKNLFTNTTGSYGSEGLAQRLNGILLNYLGPGGVMPTEIQGQSSLIDSLQSQKADWDARLANEQTALQEKYANMETALSTLQSQGSALSSAITKLGADS